jgi:preprotein translocase subunit SecA
MRQQREIMYKERDDIMSQDSLGDIVKGMFEQSIEHTVRKFTKHDGKHDVVDVDGVLRYVSKNYMLLASLSTNNKFVVENNPKKLTESLSEVTYLQYQNRFNKELPAEIKLDYERRVLLGVIDHSWINHIDAMQKLRNGIYLRAYAQKDPLQEYTEEAFYMFEEMTKSISEDIARNIVHMGIAPGSAEEKQIPALQIELEFQD